MSCSYRTLINLVISTPNTSIIHWLPITLYMNDLVPPTSPNSYILPCSVYQPCRPSLTPWRSLKPFNHKEFARHVASVGANVFEGSVHLPLTQPTSLRKPSLNPPVRVKFPITATYNTVFLLPIKLVNYNFIYLSGTLFDQSKSPLLVCKFHEGCVSTCFGFSF